ncbi:hypothetical protein B0O99DRAFT_508405 [Bisporella sp. PMI_857]|nr:hypothetical protein B0O99DRAFT_508405 [Bisporella sp. PMI_857]
MKGPDEIRGLEPRQTATRSLDHDVENLKNAPLVEATLAGEGAQRIELMQQIWGKHGKKLVFTALGICMVAYEFDETTFSTYYAYALSDFRKTASSAALTTACNLAFSLMKPLWAKLSDIFGRAEIYPAAMTMIIVGLVTAASASNFNAFAAGTVLRVMGITALNSLNTIVIADLTTTRQRGFGVNFQFFPYLILPWVSSYIVEKVVSPGGIGWAWGIGIIAIIFPLGTLPITGLLGFYQQRAKKLEKAIVKPPRISLYEIVSSIDLVGIIIMVTSLAFVLLPLSLANLQKDGYNTPWIIALIVIGCLGLTTALPYWENRVAKHPFFPLRYVLHRTIGLAFLLYFTDCHEFLYNWALIAQGFTIMQATNLSFVNSVLTFLTGIIFGLIMWKTRTYKWWIMAGCAIRLIGYGVMFRIRNAHPTMAELFIVQVIQGIGDGIVQTGGYVAATVNVPHAETATMAALIVMAGTLGSAVGSAISGAIYTGTFREELAKQLGSRSTPELIEALFNSINLDVPAWGSPERIAINTAVSIEDTN